MAIRTEALILRGVDYGESDRILHLLTPEHGRLTAIAKGARRSVKRFPGTLDFFNHLRVQLDRRRPTAMARLDQASLLRVFGKIRVEPARFALGCYLLELLDRLAPEGGARDDVGRLFDFALEALEVLDRVAPDLRLRTLLEIRALDALGVRPELRLCVRCGREISPRGKIGFHVADGGPVCESCTRPAEDVVSIHLGTLRALERGLRLDLAQLGRISMGRACLAEARELVSRFQRFHLDVTLRSEAFLDQVLADSAKAQNVQSAQNVV